MSHFGKEMKRNVDERNISGVDNQLIKDNDDRLSMINSKDKKVRLPIELQQALHLSSRADANVSLQANSKNSIGESLTLSPQSGDRNHEMHRLLDPRDHYHRKHNHDHNIRAEALSQLVNNNSCNSSTQVYNMNMLLADDRRYTPFVLPKSAWPILNSSMEEPVLFSSSILHGNPMPDQSFMSTAMPKTTPTLHSLVDLPYNMQQRSLPFNNHTNNTMQIIEGSLHNISSYHNDSNMNDPDYPYPSMPSYHNDSNMNDQDYPYPSMPSYSSYPTSPSLPAEESNHIDFFAVDGRGTDCGFYQRQYLQGDDQTAYMAYHNISQVQNWHNVMQQDGHQGVSPSYTPSSQGMIPVMPISYPSNYHALNSMDWQTEHHLNVQQGWHVPIPSHSQPLPMYMNHSGTQQTMISLVEHTNHIALNNVLKGCTLTEGLASSLTTSTGSAGRQALRKPSSCKDSFWLSYTVEDDQASDQFCGEGAGAWKMQQRLKGMGKPSNKRQTPDGEEDDQQHDYAPPLKRSATWNCMSYSDTNPTIDHTLKPYNRSCAKASPKQEKQPARQGIANDPQSIAARHRRERISERLKILQQLVPNGSKVDLVTMLEKAINYVKFLQLQVKVLATDEYWPTSLNKVPKVVAMAKLADHSKKTTMENVEKAPETC